MEDSTLSIVGIIIASILMFIVPLILIADRGDDISQLTVETLTAQFVDNIIKQGKITNEDYQSYLASLQSSGNTYDVSIEIKILDKNTAQRETNLTSAVGQNSYYSIFTTQIQERLASTDSDENLSATGQIILKEGDIISVTTKNSSKTLSQTLKNVYYTIKGEDLHIIASTSTGTVAVNGAI